MSKIIKIADLIQDDNNFNRHTTEGMELLKKSVQAVGVIESITVSSDDKVISGNARQEKIREVLGDDAEPIIIETDGTRPVVLKRTDIDSGTKKYHEAALLANTTAKRNINLDLDLIQNNDRFIIPPFSILDCKSGKWQERKNAWLSLGIKSEIGREENLAYAKSSQPARIYEVRNRLKEKTGIIPTWETVFEYCNAHNIPLQEGTSIFDPVLCELVYRWFNTPNGTILDPFAGGSVRGIVASKLGMNYNGVDLRKEQIDANYQNAKTVIGENIMPTWLCGDSLNIDNLFLNKTFDLIFSCPPYADLEVYSNDDRDLSNMDYYDFIKIYTDIIRKSCLLLNENRFAVFVVGEVRDKTGVYYNFVSDTIYAFRCAGLSYYNEMILATQIGSMAIRVSRQFNNGRKIGKIHQNVLVFYKGDVKEIKNNYPEIDFSDEDSIFEN